MHDCFKYQFSWLSDLPWHILRSGRTSPVQDQTLTEAETPLGKLFVGLEGSRLVVPRIEDLSPKWKVAVNPHLMSIQGEYGDWVKQLVRPSRWLTTLEPCSICRANSLCMQMVQGRANTSKDSGPKRGRLRCYGIPSRRSPRGLEPIKVDRMGELRNSLCQKSSPNE